MWTVGLTTISVPFPTFLFQARREPQWGPGKILAGLSGEKICDFFKWHILMYFIFLSNGVSPKRRGARGNLLPHHQSSLHFPYFPFPLFSLLFLLFPFSPFPPLRSMTPKIPARESGKRCELPPSKVCSESSTKIEFCANIVLVYAIGLNYKPACLENNL